MENTTAVLEHFVLQARRQRDHTGFGLVLFKPLEAFTVGASEGQKGRCGQQQQEGNGAEQERHFFLTIGSQKWTKLPVSNGKPNTHRPRAAAP